MIIFLYGEETYQSRQRMQEIKKAYIAEYAHGAVIVYDCDDECDHMAIIRSMGMRDLFAQKKMIIVRNFFVNTGAAEQKIMQNALAIDTDDVIVMWENSMPRKNATLFMWLKEHAKETSEFSILKDQKLEKWIIDRVHADGANISQNAVAELIAYTGNDMWHIAMELDKLIGYVGDGMIDAEHVRDIVHGKIDADMFETIEAISDAQKTHALHLLHQQRAKGDDSYYIFSMYVYQIRLLLRVASVVEEMHILDKNSVAKVLKIHPFVAQKTLGLVRRMSYDRIKKAHHILSVFDHEIKTGKKDVNTALDLFVMGA